MVKKQKKNKHKCPSCPKAFQSKKQLDAHCYNYHQKSYDDLKAIKDKSNMTLGDFIKVQEGDE